MTITRAFFASRELAESLTGNPHVAIISITTPGTPAANLDQKFHRVLRLSFFDAVPADPYIPSPIPGMFDQEMARQISDFVGNLHVSPYEVALLVHCEYGISRSSAVALFVEAFAGAPLEAREFTYEANPWIIDLFLKLHPGLEITIPARMAARERRSLPRI